MGDFIEEADEQSVLPHALDYFYLFCPFKKYQQKMTYYIYSQ